MKSTLLTLILTGTLIGASGLAQAQEIQERKENQQDRIANGVANGSLTPHETANLEHKEAGLNKEIRHDRRQNGGNLTNKEKAQVNRRQAQRRASVRLGAQEEAQARHRLFQYWTVGGVADSDGTFAARPECNARCQADVGF
jgi:broad specificity phosphatase PhoE